MADNNEFFNENFDDIFGEFDDENENTDDSLSEEVLKESDENFQEGEENEPTDEALVIAETLNIDELEFDEDLNTNLDVEIEKEKKIKKIDFKKKINNIKSEVSKYKDIKNLTVSRFYNIIKVILALILILIFGVTSLERIILKSRVEKDIISIKQSEFISNLPSFIYIQEEIEVGGEVITLNKMLIDSNSTILYFDPGYSNLNIEEYILYIVDENNQYYGVKRAEAGVVNGEYVIPVKLLEEGIKQFTINIVGLYSDENIVLAFKLDDGIKVPPAKYANGEVKINYDSDVSLDLINAQFTPASSSLDFLLETDNLSTFEYIVGYGEKEEKVILYENGVRIRSNKAKEKIYNVDDRTTKILSINFNPVKSLSSIIELIINGIYKKYEVDEIFGTRELLLKEIQDYHTIKLDDYNVNLEGMKRYNDKIVLVAHAVDTKYYDNMYTPPEVVQSKNIYDPVIEPEEAEEIDMSDPYANRIPVFIDATLLVHIEGEEPFELKGDIKTLQKGSDILFEDERLKNTTSKDYDLRIDNILFEEEDLRVKLDLKDLKYSLDELTVKNLDFITNSLTSRLKYKSKEEVFSRISGFSDEVLNDESIMASYTPIDIITPAKYDVTIDSYVYRDDMFIAIATEQWTGLTETGFVHYQENHEIHVKITDDELQIVKDNIIQLY